MVSAWCAPGTATLGWVKSNAKNTRTGYRYGPGREKARRLDYPSAGALSASGSTEYVLGAEVRVEGGAIKEVSRYVGSIIVKQRVIGANSTVQQQYLVTDALGSTELVLDIWGQVVNPNASMSFDAFGQRRQADAWTTPTPWTPSLRLDIDAATRHGYTGHEQADEVGIVHMNGRIYDPLLGRFLQADPFVQAPTNGQSHNRYSYVFNNPMAYTDPTGYFGSKERAGVRTGVAIVASFFLGPALQTYAGLTSTQAAIVTGAVAGGIQSGNVRGAAMGALTAAAFTGIDRAFGVADAGAAGLSNGKFALRALANGAAGGVLAKIQGGNFGHGFINAGLGDYLSPADRTIDTDPSDLLKMTLAGGSLSMMTGDSFANGAMTAALRSTRASALNQKMSEAAYGNRDDWTAWEYEWFVFFSMEEHAPTVVSPAVEGVVLGGYSSKEKWYAAGIVAEGVSVNAPGVSGTYMVGLEATHKGHVEPIMLSDVGVNFGPGPLWGVKGFVGGYYMPQSGNAGVYGGTGVHLFGLEGSVGVGGSLDIREELARASRYSFGNTHYNYQPYNLP